MNSVGASKLLARARRYVGARPSIRISAPATTSTTMSSWGRKCCGTNDRGPTVELVLDRVRSDRRVVVLPEAEYAPALADEDGLILRISLAVGEQLAPPELRVRLREVGVLLAVVPEASVDEDSDPGAWEHQIRTHSAQSTDSPIDEEASSPAVELASDGELGLSVPAAEPRHVSSAPVVRFPVLHLEDRRRVVSTPHGRTALGGRMSAEHGCEGASSHRRNGSGKCPEDGDAVVGW